MYGGIVCVGEWTFGGNVVLANGYVLEGGAGACMGTGAYLPIMVVL